MTIIKATDVGTDTVLDRLYRAHLEHKTDDLNEEDKQILARITEVDKRFTEKQMVKTKIKGKEVEYERPYNFKELVNWLTELFGISHRQAYADIAMAKQFFLIGQGREDKEFGRGQQILIGEEMMYAAYSQGDFKSAAAFYKEINEIKRLKTIDPEVIDRAKMMPNEYIVTNDPSEIGFEKMDNPDEVVERLKKSFKKGLIDVMSQDAEEIEYNEPGQDISE